MKPVVAAVVLGLALQACQTSHGAAGGVGIGTAAAPAGGAGLIANNAGGLVANNAGNLIANNAGNLIANNAGSLIANNAGSFTGVVRGPAAGLIANNAAGLISNNAGGLIANNAGGLISNNSGGLIANNAAGYRVRDLAALTMPVSGARVAAFDAQGQALSDPVTTDASGNYRLGALKPSRSLVYVRAAYSQEGQTVLLEAATSAPRNAGSTPLAIDPAGTLASKKVEAVLGQGSVVEADINPDLIGQIASTVAPQLDARTLVAASIFNARASAGSFDTFLRDHAEIRTQIAALTDGSGPMASALVAAVSKPVLPPARALTVTTLAGSGVAGFLDGPAASARFSYPNGMALDAAGNLYVADSGNHRIRKVAPDGTTTTFAGGQAGYADGPALQARFNNPTGLAIDATGNLYVADSNNQRIRVISAAGQVSTLAGGATPGYADGTGSTVAFNTPTDLVVDAAKAVYVLDTGNHSLRKVSADGSVTTLAGNGTPGYADGLGNAARFNAPAALAFDGTKFYVADQLNYRVRQVTLAGQVSLLAGSGASSPKDGPAGQAAFPRPTGLALDAQGNVFVADAWSQDLREIFPSGAVVTATWPDAAGDATRFNGPTRLLADGQGGLFVADNLNHRIRHVH